MWLNGTYPASAPNVAKKSRAIAPPGLRIFSPARSAAVWIGRVLVVR
jgi:hypothetical protein